MVFHKKIFKFDNVICHLWNEEYEKILKQISEKDTTKENRVDEYFKKNPIIKNHEIRKIQSGNLNSIK